MKNITMTILFASLIIGGAAGSTSVLARVDAKEKGLSTVKSSTSHNPLTRTTTHTLEKEAEHDYKDGDQSGKIKHTIKVQRKTSDDGKKATVKTEETRLDQRD